MTRDGSRPKSTKQRLQESIIETNVSNFQKKLSEDYQKKQIIVKSLRIRNVTQQDKDVRRDLFLHKAMSKGGRNSKKIEINQNIKPFSPRKCFDRSKSRDLSRTYRTTNMIKT
jgi:hypothetical protein